VSPSSGAGASNSALRNRRVYVDTIRDTTVDFADEVGLHKLKAGDSASLLALIHRITKKAERTRDGPVTSDDAAGTIDYHRVF